jgi:glutathione S-transferase
MSRYDDEYADLDLLAEDREARRRRARWNHWCDVCHGHLGPGSPCAPEEDEPEQTDDEQERDE